MSKPRCPHCSREVAKGLDNYCPHCGNSVRQLSKSAPWEPDLSNPVERERLWAEQNAPMLAKAEHPQPTLEELDAAWDRIMAPRPHPLPIEGYEPPRPQLWDYIEKAAPARVLDPIEAEAVWEDILAPSRIRHEWELEDERARFATFVDQLAKAIKDRPAAKAASTPAEPQWQNLSRAEKAALLPPRPRPDYLTKYDHGQAGN